MNFNRALLVAITLISNFSPAQELPPEVTNPSPEIVNSKRSELWKQSYLPFEGISYSEIGFSFLSSKGNIKAASANLADVKTTSNNFDYLIGFGVSDHLAIGAQGTYPISKT